MTGVISGKALGATINGIAVGGEFGWRARGVAGRLDGTTGRDGGFGSTKPGVRDLDVTLQLVINILSGVTGINEGDQLVNLRLYYDIADPIPAIVVSVFTVLEAEQTGQVRERFEYIVQGANDGPYTRNK